MTSPLLVLLLAVVLSASVTVLGHYIRPARRALIYIFKPLTTILIVAVAMLPGTVVFNPYARTIVLGLLLSLMGDIWLVMPGDRFVQGLGSFLLAHICYAFAFRAGAAAHEFPWAALALAALGAGILAYLWSGLPSGLKGPVSAYVAVILIMAALAVGRALGQRSIGSLLAAVGALLFVASDGTLAVNRFRRPFRLADAVVLFSYFAAQTLIALSPGKTQF